MFSKNFTVNFLILRHEKYSVLPKVKSIFILQVPALDRFVQCCLLEIAPLQC